MLHYSDFASCVFQYVTVKSMQIKHLVSMDRLFYLLNLSEVILEDLTTLTSQFYDLEVLSCHHHLQHSYNLHLHYLHHLH